MAPLMRLLAALVQVGSPYMYLVLAVLSRPSDVLAPLVHAGIGEQISLGSEGLTYKLPISRRR